jgi:hypothetical protein
MKTGAERDKLWMRMLDGIDDKAVEAAVEHILTMDREYPPTIGILRTKALEILSGELGALTGAEAWADVAEKISGRDVELSERQKQALKATGTIYDLKRSQNPSSDRARFILAYDSIVSRKKLERSMMPSAANFEDGQIGPGNSENKTHALPPSKAEKERTAEEQRAVDEARKECMEKLGGLLGNKTLGGE